MGIESVDFFHASHEVAPRATLWLAPTGGLSHMPLTGFISHHVHFTSKVKYMVCDTMAFFNSWGIQHNNLYKSPNIRWYC